MNEISAKTRFFLEHRVQIMEWARLENVAAADVHRWFAGWSEPMSERPPEPDAMLWDETSGSSYVQLLWYRPSWQPLPGARPSVGLGFEWNAGRPIGATSPFCGIRVGGGSETPAGAALWDALRERVLRVPDLAPHGKNKWWPVMFGVDSGILGAMTAGPLFASEGSEDPLEPRMEAFRERCFEAAYKLWSELADAVDEVMGV